LLESLLFSLEFYLQNQEDRKSFTKEIQISDTLRAKYEKVYKRGKIRNEWNLFNCRTKVFTLRQERNWYFFMGCPKLNWNIRSILIKNNFIKYWFFKT